MGEPGTLIHKPVQPVSREADHRQGLSAERTALVLMHLHLADVLARRYWKSRSDFADIQQTARLGLLQAAIRFNMDGDSSFVAFAVPTICGEIKRHLRDHGWAVRPPRRIQELRAHLFRLTPELAQQLGREPTTAELATVLCVKAKDVEEALLSESSISPQSLDGFGGDTDETPLFERLRSAEDAFARVDDALSLRCALRELTEWERQLLALRFQEELNQQQIGSVLNISQMQVSRALAALLAKLRAQLGEH